MFVVGLCRVKPQPGGLTRLIYFFCFALFLCFYLFIYFFYVLFLFLFFGFLVFVFVFFFFHCLTLTRSQTHTVTPHFTDLGFSPKTKSSRSLSKSRRQSDLTHRRHRGTSRVQTHPLIDTVSHSHVSPSLPTV
jgi:uncharacterized protein (DUF58 family)